MESEVLLPELPGIQRAHTMKREWKASQAPFCSGAGMAVLLVLLREVQSCCSASNTLVLWSRAESLVWKEESSMGSASRRLG